MDSLIVGKRKTSEETASGETGEKLDLLETINTAIQIMQRSLKAKGCEKGSLSDLVRLLQLKKELEAERPRHISVRWIEQDEC